MSRLLVLLGLCLALAVCTSAGAASGWKTHADRKTGFSIDVPSRWQVVPRTPKAVKALAARLRKQGKGKLADQLAVLAAGKGAAKSLASFRFQAFRWPAPKGPITTDVTVKVDAVPPGYRATDLKRVAAGVAKSLRAVHGSTAAAPVKLTVPAGPAWEIRGTLPLGTKTKLRSAYTLVLILGRDRMYELAFRSGVARAKKEAKLYRAIERRFRLL